MAAQNKVETNILIMIFFIIEIEKGENTARPERSHVPGSCLCATIDILLITLLFWIAVGQLVRDSSEV